ncbi:MAG: caspase family protein, partial [Bacteroidota bacterium]
MKLNYFLSKALLLFILCFVLAAPNLRKEAEFAEIHIFRPKQFQGGAVVFQVLANAQKLVHLSNGSRSVLRVFNEGAIDFKLKASVFTSKTVSLGVVKGQKYYLKAGYDDGFGSKLSFVPIEENLGENAFSDLRQYHRPKIKIIEDRQNRFRTLSEDDLYSESVKEIEQKEGSKPRLGWISPGKNYEKTEVNIFSLQLCLMSESDQLEVKIVHNGEIFEQLEDIPVSGKKCSYTYITNLNLAPGANKIEIFLTDEFGESKFTRHVTFHEEKKNFKRGLALVIGNSDYSHTTNLVNPKNDAADIQKALERLNF